MDLVSVLGEVGTTVAIVVLFVWIFRPFISRLMDNLDRYGENQAKVAVSLDHLCERLNGSEGRDEEAARERTEIVKALQDLSAVVRGLQQQQQAHEGRAAKRHEQVMAHADERHAELIGVLKGMNGKH